MNLVKLTRPDGKELYVNPDQVCMVEYSTSQYDTVFTMITLITSERRPVAETVPEAIAMLTKEQS